MSYPTQVTSEASALPTFVYQAVFDHSEIAKCLLSPSDESTILAVNDAFLQVVGRTREQLIGRPLFDAFPENPDEPAQAGVAALKRSLQRVRATRERESLPIQRYPVTSRKADGTVLFEERYWSVTNVPIFDHDGKFICINHCTQDVTEKWRMEQELRNSYAEQRNVTLEAGRIKDELLAMLAHELRNPLAPIAAAADLLLLGRANSATIRKASAVIARQVNHMTGLVDDLLDISRVTRGKVKLDQERVDVNHIALDAIEQVRPLVEAHGHELTLHASREEAAVRGDSKRLVQVLTNLLSNAAKYTPDGGQITVRIEVDAGVVQLSVKDTGMGMPGDLVNHCFDLFVQAARTSERAAGGLGIGLALVKSLVELHGGSVWAQSEGLGKGSSFNITLPQAAPAEQPALTPAVRRERLQKAADRLRVLVVDDNEDAAEMLAMLVEALGHETMVEHHPRRALELVKLHPPDVCLLDVGLPEMDGYQLARSIREQSEKPPTLVAVTGYGQPADREQALRSGFHEHFPKPLNRKKLEELLQRVQTAS